MSAQERQDVLLRQIVAADEATSDEFFTASSQDGTTLLHNGFQNEGNQIEVAIGDVKALAVRGLLAITEYRDYGDVAFAVTPTGRADVERLEHRGMTALEVETARADRAEALVRQQQHAIADQVASVEVRRRTRAENLAWVPAAAAAIVVGVVIFILSQSGPLRVAVGILLAIGVVGTWVVAPIRRAATELLVRVLAFIHDQT